MLGRCGVSALDYAPRLFPLLRDTWPVGTRVQAVRAFAQLGKALPGTTRALTPLLADRAPEVRRWSLAGADVSAGAMGRRNLFDGRFVVGRAQARRGVCQGQSVRVPLNFAGTESI